MAPLRRRPGVALASLLRRPVAASASAAAPPAPEREDEARSPELRRLGRAGAAVWMRSRAVWSFSVAPARCVDHRAARSSTHSPRPSTRSSTTTACSFGRERERQTELQPASARGNCPWQPALRVPVAAPPLVAGSAKRSDRAAWRYDRQRRVVEERTAAGSVGDLLGGLGDGLFAACCWRCLALTSASSSAAPRSKPATAASAERSSASTRANETRLGVNAAPSSRSAHSAPFALYHIGVPPPTSGA